MKILITIYWIALAQSAFSQDTSEGPCREVGGIENFDLMDFAGTWYVYQSYNLPLGSKCISVDNILNGDGTMTFNTSGINTITGQAYDFSVNGTVTGPGKFEVMIDLPENINSSNYQVLETNYVAWAVVNTCTNVGRNQHIDIAYFLTRDGQPSQADIEAAEAALKEINIDPNQLQTIDQTNCD